MATVRRISSDRKGYSWAIEHGAHVISMSLGAGLEYGDVSKKKDFFKNAVVKKAIDQGLIVMVAAGNESCALEATAAAAA